VKRTKKISFYHEETKGLSAAFGRNQKSEIRMSKYETNSKNSMTETACNALARNGLCFIPENFTHKKQEDEGL